MRVVALVGVSLLCSCLGDGLDVPEDGGARRDLRPAVVDLATLDLAHAPAGCTQLPTWTGSAPQVLWSPTESPFDFVTWARSFEVDTELSVEIWHRGGTPHTPYTLKLPKTNYLDCEVCVLVDLAYDASRGYGAPAFLALAGSVTVTRADTGSHGKLDVSGTDLHLVEWDFGGDRPLSGGGCYDVARFSLQGSYSGDGGDPPRWK